MVACVVSFYVYIILFNFVQLSLSEVLGVASSMLPFIANYLLMFIVVIAFIFIDVGMWHLDLEVALLYEKLEENKEIEMMLNR